MSVFLPQLGALHAGPGVGRAAPIHATVIANPQSPACLAEAAVSGTPRLDVSEILPHG